MIENVLSIIISVVGFLIILSIVVIIHEAGHFFTARKFGIKVEEFGFGFPPRLWGKKRKGTIYSINWIPLGGFVKLFGEDDAGGGKLNLKDKNHEVKSDLNHAYFTKPAWQRALVVLAGVIMNFVLAVVIFYIILVSSGFKTEITAQFKYDFHFTEQTLSSQIFISNVSERSPAADAGITPRSQILELNGKKFNSMKEFIDSINSNKGKEITLVWINSEGSKKSGELIPRKNPPKDQGAIGVTLGSFDIYQLSYNTPAQKIVSGFIYPIDLLLLNLTVIKDLVATSFEEKSTEEIGRNISGPLGIFVVVGVVVSESENIQEILIHGLTLIGLLSLMLAFFNILPIPALDGGRLLFILIEMITGKKISPSLEAKINMVSFVFLIGLILYITVFFDIPKVRVFINSLFGG